MSKLHTLKNLNWRWAWNYYRKQCVMYQSYFFSKLVGRKHYTAHIDGLEVGLGFIHPYHHLFAKSLYRGKHEQDLLVLWKKEAEKVSSGAILDIGGYNGIYGLVAGLVNQRARVFIFEPDLTNANQIKENIKLNNLPDITVIQAAISGQSGEVGFKIHPGATAGIVTNKENSLSVQSMTIAQWAGKYKQLPALIKFDISGFEQDALLASEDILKQAKQLRIFLEFYPHIHSEAANQKFWSFLKNLGCESRFLRNRNDGISEYYFVSKN